MTEVELRHADGIGHLELRRPARHNAVDPALLAGLGRALDHAERLGPALRCLVVSGAGASFCSGADLRAVGDLDVAAARAFMLEAAWSFRRLERLAVPVVAAVRGYCLGGGLELALHCDVVVATADARFGFPEAGIGLITTTGSVDRLIQAIGSMRARQLLLSGRQVPGDEAAAIGLVSALVDGERLDAAALDHARALASRAGPGLAATKAMVRERIDAGARASWIGEAEAFERLFRLRRDAAERAADREPDREPDRDRR